jgi:hypothetical protein
MPAGGVAPQRMTDARSIMTDARSIIGATVRRRNGR